MDAIVAYAKLPPNTGETEKRLSLRPSIEDSRAALRDLLQKVQLPIAKSTPDT
jgi:hypothetical protein